MSFYLTKPKESDVKKVAHLIIGLGDGGAERTLFKLVTNDCENEHVVFTLQEGGKYHDLLLLNGIEVREFRLSKITSLGPALLWFIRELREYDAQIVHAWMPHAALLASMAIPFAGFPRLLWGMRASSYGHGPKTLATRALVRVLSLLSWIAPETILVVGHRAMEAHASYGFCPRKLVVIENGYGLEGAGSAISSPPPEPVLRLVYTGTVFPGRRDPSPLFEAINIVSKRRGTAAIRVEFYGKGLESIPEIAERFGVESNVVVAGEVVHSAVEEIQDSADILLLMFWNHPTEKYSFSGKLFEYVRSQRPILAIGMPDGEGPRLVQTGGFGEVHVLPEDIAQYLERCLEQKKNLGGLPSPKQDINRFRREFQSLRLLDEISQVTSLTPSGSRR